MIETTTPETHAFAATTFAGLTPRHSTVPTDETTDAARRRRARAARHLTATMPIVLVSSMALSLGLAAPAAAAPAQPIKKTFKPRGAAELGKSLRDALAAATATVTPTITPASTAPASIPTTYRVVAGDTVSSIAGRFGLSTPNVLALNGLSWSSLIFPGQELTLTNGTPVPAAPVDATSTGSQRYTIVAGDTISAIANRFGVSTQSILTANGLSWSSIIYPGQSIAIPATGPSAAAPVANVPAPQAPQSPAVVAPPAAPTSVSYTIVRGDTITGIARSFGVSVQAVLDANGLTASSIIYAGRTLTIPGRAPVTTPLATRGSVTPMNDEMRANARIIVQVGRTLGVPDYGIVIALAAAAQESTLRNIPWGDRDSVGLFQQRPSTGWGTVEQLTDPTYASRLFYGGASNPNKGKTRGLLDIPGWQSMSVTVAAQAVQISAFPDAYAKWETSARAWLAELG